MFVVERSKRLRVWNKSLSYLFFGRGEHFGKGFKSENMNVILLLFTSGPNICIMIDGYKDDKESPFETRKQIQRGSVNHPRPYS